MAVQGVMMASDGLTYAGFALAASVSPSEPERMRTNVLT